jgi:hypothetical protein
VAPAYPQLFCHPAHAACSSGPSCSYRFQQVLVKRESRRFFHSNQFWILMKNHDRYNFRIFSNRDPSSSDSVWIFHIESHIPLQIISVVNQSLFNHITGGGNCPTAIGLTLPRSHYLNDAPRKLADLFSKYRCSKKLFSIQVKARLLEQDKSTFVSLASG